MRLNKNTSFVLIHLLGGADSAAQIAEQMPTPTLRSVQRALVRLNEGGIIERHGVTDPRYDLNYEMILKQPANMTVLENVDRPKSTFNFALLDWLLDADDRALAAIFPAGKLTASGRREMTKRELEYLTVEFSWKSSALEGNTYSLLDTELLLLRGVQAKNKTSFETQMILNHKSAIEFIIEHPELFKDAIAFTSVEEIHKRIGYNLGIGSGIRRRVVKISASNYEPPTSPAKLRECADSILAAIGKQRNSFIKALLALACMPYLQPFEDGNKRIGRMLANAVLIHSAGHGISLRNIDAKRLALAYLSFYELNSLDALAKILGDELRQPKLDPDMYKITE